MKTDPAKSRARKARRVERVAENAALHFISGDEKFPSIAPKSPQDAQERPINAFGVWERDKPRKSTPRRSKPLANNKQKVKRKKSPSRKSLVKKADTAFSLHIRALYPTSFFSGKPTECCFHIITRSKHSVRWALDNAVGSTMGENYEMEFNPHKFISILIQKRGLPWYENLIRRSNEIRKHTRQDLEQIAAVGHDGAVPM